MMACQVARQAPCVEAVPLGQLAHVREQDRGTVELTDLDAHPALHAARVGEVPRTLGEAELVGPALSLRQRGLGTGLIATHKAEQRQDDSTVRASEEAVQTARDPATMSHWAWPSTCWVLRCCIGTPRPTVIAGWT